MSGLQVWRYEMPTPGMTKVVELPITSRFIHFDTRSDSPVPILHAWFVIDTTDVSEQGTHTVEFSVIPTGADFPPGHFYLATYVHKPSQTVWHLTSKEITP